MPARIRGTTIARLFEMSGPKTLKDALTLPVLSQLEYIARISEQGLSPLGVEGDTICYCSDKYGVYMIEHVQPEGWVRVRL